MDILRMFWCEANRKKLSEPEKGKGEEGKEERKDFFFFLIKKERPPNLFFPFSFFSTPKPPIFLWAP